jgi:hypothetical protein
MKNMTFIYLTCFSKINCNLLLYGTVYGVVLPVPSPRTGEDLVPQTLSREEVCRAATRLSTEPLWFLFSCKICEFLYHKGFLAICATYFGADDRVESRKLKGEPK